MLTPARAKPTTALILNRTFNLQIPTFMNKAVYLAPVVIIIACVGVYMAINNSGSPKTTTPTTSGGNPTPQGGTPTPTTPPKTPPSPTPPTPTKPAEVVKYKTATCMDTQGTGMKAFSILIPSNWTFDGHITWLLDNPIMPATSRFTVRSPDGKIQLEGLPNQSLFWTTNQLILYANPPGSRYFGALVMQPIGAINALKQLVVPVYRGDMAGLKYVKEEGLPELAKLFPQGTDPTSGMIYSAEAGRVRVEYTLAGIVMEDEIYCVIQSIKLPLGQVTNDNWFVSYVASFRAPKGELDKNAKTLQTIAYSASIDVNWLNKYNQLVYNLIQQQIRQIKSIGQLSQMLSQTSDEISQDNLKSWEDRQAINDKIVDDFTHGILEVDKYYDPIAEKTVELPSGYTNAWTNSLGEYILSDSPSYNPNIGSNLNWQQMSTK